MGTLSRFDVALVLFPFTEKTGQKQRPAVVLSHADFNASHGQIVGVMVTTASNTQWPSDTPITGLSEAGLERPSVMRLKFVSIVDELVVGRIGRLSTVDSDVLSTAIGGLFLK